MKKLAQWGFLMSDWEVVSNPEQESQLNNSSSWSVVSEKLNNIPIQPQESFARSAGMAIPRIGSDLITGLYDTIKSIPGVLSSAPNTIPAVANELIHNPGQAIGQTIGGLAELGHGLLNLPHAAAQYGANRLNLYPSSIADLIPKQRDIQNDINQTVGLPQNEGQALLRGLGRNALNIAGGAELATVLNPLKLTKNNLAKDIIKTRKENIGHYNDLYNNLWKDAENKGASDLSHVVDRIDTNALRDLNPTSKVSRVEKFLEDPTLENAHNARSDLLGIKRKLDKKDSLIGDERQQYSAVNNAINALNENMFKDAEGNINNALLDQYNNITAGYAKDVVPYKSRAINRYLRNEITKDEMLNSLKRGVFGSRAYQNHPALMIRNNLELLKNPWLAIPGGALIGGDLLYNRNKQD